MLSKTHRRDVIVGDIFDEKIFSEYIIRLFADPWKDGTIGWVDFEVYEVVSYDMKTREKFFQKKDSNFSPDCVTSFAEAETAASGSVKWDGCTQFDVSSVHVDSRKHLDRLFAAICQARRECAAEMPDKLVAEEYA